jgi:hypothetical protein
MPNVSCPATGVYEVVLSAAPHVDFVTKFKDPVGNDVFVKTRATRTLDFDGPGGNDPVTVPVADVLAVICPDTTTDTDSDGCTDYQETGPLASAGGQRNALNFWDFYDVPDITETPMRDRVVNIDDLFLIIPRFAMTGDPNIDPLSVPPPAGYHPAYDRTYAGPDPWDLGPANGSIDIDDIFAYIPQAHHSCAI